MICRGYFARYLKSRRRLEISQKGRGKRIGTIKAHSLLFWNKNFLDRFVLFQCAVYEYIYLPVCSFLVCRVISNAKVSSFRNCSRSLYADFPGWSHQPIDQRSMDRQCRFHPVSLVYLGLLPSRWDLDPVLRPWKEQNLRQHPGALLQHWKYQELLQLFSETKRGWTKESVAVDAQFWLVLFGNSWSRRGYNFVHIEESPMLECNLNWVFLCVCFISSWFWKRGWSEVLRALF